ncbi:tail fiber protein [Vibrio coralliilyticus]|uniref:tail fiber protein n=1 Tax=Vibrio coralliilyticus TaxID=190893 RepID=UPI00180C7A43|nr:tail fiber protein [Vibrio coralliilyticus]NUW69549.1 tail fiber protein [Vibrio coralliilyticus]
MSVYIPPPFKIEFPEQIALSDQIDGQRSDVAASEKAVGTLNDKTLKKTSLSDKVSSTQKTVATSKAVSLVNKVANAALIKANTARVIAGDAMPKSWVQNSFKSTSNIKPPSAYALKIAYDLAYIANSTANAALPKAKLSNSVSSAHQDYAATSYAVREAYNLATTANKTANAALPKTNLSSDLLSNRSDIAATSRAVKQVHDLAKKANNLAEAAISKSKIAINYETDTLDTVASSKLTHDLNNNLKIKIRLGPEQNTGKQFEPNAWAAVPAGNIISRVRINNNVRGYYYMTIYFRKVLLG